MALLRLDVAIARGVPDLPVQSPPRHRTTTLGLAAVLTGLDAGSFGPVLPSLRAGLSLDDPQAAWLISAYVVGTLLGSPANAWLNARRGTSRALAAGFAVYAAGALLLASAHGLAAACAGRWLQGLGSGSLLPLATAAVAASAPPSRRGRAIVLVALTYGVAFLLASASAPWVAAHAWRALYLGLAATALLSGALTAALLPEARPAEPAPFDARGAALWCAALASLAVILWQSRGGRAGVPFVLLALTVAATALVAGVRAGRRVEQPFVPLHLLREPAVRACCVLSLAAGAGQVFAVSLPSFAVVVAGVAPARVGLWSLPFVLSGLGGTALAAAIIDRLGAPRVVRAAGAALVLGAGALAVAPGSRAPFALASAVVGAGLCTLSGGPIRHLVGVVEGPDGARAQALLSLVTNLGLLLGSALYAACASPGVELARRAGGMRGGTAAVAATAAVGLAAGLRMLPRAGR